MKIQAKKVKNFSDRIALERRKTMYHSYVIILQGLKKYAVDVLGRDKN
jgi:hypothetical protein